MRWPALRIERNNNIQSYWEKCKGKGKKSGSVDNRLGAGNKVAQA
jgi:hypothetical protein